MEKTSFKLDEKVAAALQSFAAFNQETGTPRAEPDVPLPEEGPRRAAEAAATPDAVWAWYRAMRPGVMNKFDWLVMLNCQAARSGGVIVIGDLARDMRVRPDKLARALNELALAGWITVLRTERGSRGRTISKTIRVNPIPEK